MATPKFLSYLGIAKEAAHAAGVDPTAVAPTAYIPVKDLKPFDNVKYLTDENWRGSMVKDYGLVQGNIHSEFEFSGDVFPDTIPWVFAAVLGDYAKTGSTAPYSHTIAQKNNGLGQATSYTLTDFNGYNARAFAGMQGESFELKFNAEGLLEYTCMMKGWGSATATTPTPSFGSVPQVPVWTGTTTLGGTTVARLADGSVKVNRPTTPIFTVDGNQKPYQQFQGASEVTGSLKLVYEDDTDLTRFLSNTQPSLAINWAQGSGTSATSVAIQLTKCAFEVAKIDRSKDYVELDVTFRGLANATDVGASAGYSPIKIVVQNAISTAAYA